MDRHGIHAPLELGQVDRIVIDASKWVDLALLAGLALQRQWVNGCLAVWGAPSRGKPPPTCNRLTIIWSALIRSVARVSDSWTKGRAMGSTGGCETGRSRAPDGLPCTCQGKDPPQAQARGIPCTSVSRRRSAARERRGDVPWGSGFQDMPLFLTN